MWPKELNQPKPSKSVYRLLCLLAFLTAEQSKLSGKCTREPPVLSQMISGADLISPETTQIKHIRIRGIFEFPLYKIVENVTTMCLKKIFYLRKTETKRWHRIVKRTPRRFELDWRIAFECWKRRTCGYLCRKQRILCQIWIRHWNWDAHQRMTNL